MGALIGHGLLEVRDVELFECKESIRGPRIAVGAPGISSH